MSKTTVAHVNAHNRFTDSGVFVGRPSRWGNPFKIGRDGTREEVIDKYAAWVVQQPHLMAALGELKGKTLLCYCHPQACHGDVLAALADKGINDAL